jgi:hypothetical protein
MGIGSSKPAVLLELRSPDRIEALIKCHHLLVESSISRDSLINSGLIEEITAIIRGSEMDAKLWFEIEKIAEILVENSLENGLIDLMVDSVDWRFVGPFLKRLVNKTEWKLSERLLEVLLMKADELKQKPDEKSGFRLLLEIFAKISLKFHSRFLVERNLLSTIDFSVDIVSNPFTHDSIIECLTCLCEAEPVLVSTHPLFASVMYKVFFGQKIGVSSRSLAGAVELLLSLMRSRDLDVIKSVLESGLGLSVPSLMIEVAGPGSCESALDLIGLVLDESGSVFNRENLLFGTKQLLADARCSEGEKQKARRVLELLSGS